MLRCDRKYRRRISKSKKVRKIHMWEIYRLSSAALESPRTPLRNYAILLMMARLGLRAPEVVKITLEDLNWITGTIEIKGKGDVNAKMPMTKELGNAIVDYLKNERKGSSRSLFVSNHPPFKKLKNGGSIMPILQKCYKRTKINPPKKYIGTHIMRHSLATDMLAKGASLNEVSQVLRHRSRATTTIYAKYNIDELRALAKPWPTDWRSA